MIKKISIGIDEAGRGPLAGPMVAAGVVFENTKKQREIFKGIKESKSLTPIKREALFSPIIKNFIWSVAVFDNNFIDRYGIQAANILLFHEVAEDLRNKIKQPAEGADRSGSINIIADYVGGADRSLKDVVFHKKGDVQFKEIAAASIIAKVYRDQIMMSINKNFPDYNFNLHKGYGTAKHFDKINKHGLSSVHRKTFLKKYL
ncbi:ribonuclease HII [bacterium]|nr:ribonuclease HII [bacterium]